MDDRLTRFRALMANLDAAGDPGDAIREGWYVEPPNARRMLGRVELRPAGAHLLLGGIGSGKTTQLLTMSDHLQELPETRAFYVDVSRHHDIEQLAVGMIAKAADVALHEVSPDRGAVILLIDGLDRLRDIELFTELLRQDVQAITEAGIGVVLTGPISALFGAHRGLTDLTDSFHHLSPVDATDEAGRAFLLELLSRRVDGEVWSPGASQLLVEMSGGVLRDLIRLAQSSAEEAYLDGADRVTARHAAKAADAFGRMMMVGLDQDELAVLRRVAGRGEFVRTDDKDLGLLMTRRVLEVGRSSQRFIVHPTIAPLLAQLPAKA